MERNIFPEMHISFEDAFPRLAKIGHFLLSTPNPEVAYPSEYRRIPEPSDGEAMQPQLPFDKQAAVAHYVQMAKEAKAE